MERKYNVREITPKSYGCTLVTCPAIYEVKEITPKANMCATYICPAIFKDKIKNSYLIVGKKVNPSKFGLEKKVGENEVLVSVPKEIIDNKQD